MIEVELRHRLARVGPRYHERLRGQLNEAGREKPSTREHGQASLHIGNAVAQKESFQLV